MKESLFEQAELLYIKAKEAYEIGDCENGADFQNRFLAVLNELISFGWDKEFMGIS